ncbi:DUF6515 family protein [Spongiivirga sp. MCCC 1A20706]|uniref:DUF6515 family protein n=1 Tax=Spongiivirga sp. MCCC 1A20706 TaxID=3160963 RepID=UPI00397779A7
MKTIKLVLGIVFIALFSLSLNAQRTVIKVYPKQGVVVKKVNNPKVIIHKGINYTIANGVWYKTRGSKFVVVRPPVGIRVKTLPIGYKIVKVRGKRYFTYKGIYYKKRGRKYTVVTV